jgi:hypothetical protein
VTKTEIKLRLQDIDRSVDGIVNWIKYYYSNYKPEPTQSVDIQSIELSAKLQQYHYLQTQKTRLVNMYSNDKGGY